MTRSRVARRIEAVIAVSTIVFLVGPILFVIPMSFSNAGGLEFPPPGYSLRWYRRLADDERWGQAVKTSLTLGLLASAAALVLGGLAAYGIARSTSRLRLLLVANFMAPMAIPAIVSAVALFIAYARAGYTGSFTALVVAHTVLVVPYIIIVLQVAFEALDRRVELMARSLGASWAQAMRHVVVPLLLPSIAAAWLFAFVVSFDEVIVTLFISGRNVTVPKLMFTQLRDQVDPTVAALSTLLIVFTMLMLAAGVLVMRLARRRGTALTIPAELAPGP
jgi:ABC-type spermidine/putrescine transport system permease subunit II